MKHSILMLVLVGSLSLIGSKSGNFLVGTAGGGLGAAAGYEYNARQELDRIKSELNEGKMTQEEHDIRKDQIEKMSVLK
jgi:hypothetical protein